jgi:hypothetical protein
VGGVTRTQPSCEEVLGGCLTRLGLPVPPKATRRFLLARTWGGDEGGTSHDSLVWSSLPIRPPFGHNGPQTAVDICLSVNVTSHFSLVAELWKW